MNITCASCKSTYSLTLEQIQRLPHSILPCRNCAKLIKIAQCPSCGVYYSITFSTAQQSRYTLTCERCKKPFAVTFPVVREGLPQEQPPASEHKPAAAARTTPPRVQTTETIHAKPPPIRKRKPPLVKRLAFWKRLSKDHNKRAKKEPRLHTRTEAKPPTQTRVGLAMADLFEIAGSAFTPAKLIIASCGVCAAIIATMAYRWLVFALIEPIHSSLPEFARSMLGIFPFALMLFIYIITAAIISRLTLRNMSDPHPFQDKGMLRFIASSLFPVLIVNIILFAAADLVLLLLGHVPIVGPILFAIIFLPIYLTSLIVFTFIAVGFWFYPPIIARQTSYPVTSLLRFIRRHNFRLAYTIPLLTIITAVIFAAIYAIHYGSFAFSMFLSKAILAEEGERIFTAVPLPFLKISDLILIGTEAGPIRSFMDDIHLPHSIAGLIIGLVLSAISIVLFASFVSITATLSTRVYVIMERGSDIDDASKIRLLFALILILVGILLVKKIFM